MPYATVIDVQNRAPFRGTFGASSIPTATQVISYLEDGYAELNQCLITAGYDAPFDSYIASHSIATTGLILLREWNSHLAACRVEEGAQASDRMEEFKAKAKRIKEAIRDKEADLPFPIAGDKQMPRAPVGYNTSGASQPAQGISQVDIMPRPLGLGPSRWDL